MRQAEDREGTGVETVFQAQGTPRIKAYKHETDSLLPEDVFILPLFLKNIFFTEHRILVDSDFPPQQLTDVFYCLLASTVSEEKSIAIGIIIVIMFIAIGIIIMIKVSVFFSLAAFKIFS